jgi:hypothetical protein
VSAAPWTLREMPDDLDIAYAVEEGTVPIADVYGGPCGEFHARLIAAAPELYEAGELALKSLRLIADGEEEIAFDQVIPTLESAIAKARGEQ